jgi:hypothetical protein
MEFIRFFLVLLAPGLIGALAFSIAARFRTEIKITTALILDLLTFTTMITGLYYLKDVTTMEDLLYEFTCLSFTRKYILLSTAINVVYGVIFGIVRRFLFWIRE